MFDVRTSAAAEIVDRRRTQVTESTPAVVERAVTGLLHAYAHMLPGPYRVEYFEPFTLDGPFVLRNYGTLDDPEWVLTVTYQFCADAPPLPRRRCSSSNC